MPIFRAQVFFTHALGKWTNVYHVNAADFATALAHFTDTSVVDKLRSMEHINVTLQQIRVSDEIPGTDVFATVPIGLAGTSSDSGSLLPLFNRARVDVAVIGGGRPSRKYIAGWITESLQTDGNLETTAVTYMNTAMGGLITALVTLGSDLCDPDGQEWLTASTIRAVAMHQMHRKRRKTPTP